MIEIELYNRILPTICKYQLPEVKSLELAKNAFENEIDTIIATPSMNEQPSKQSVNKIIKSVESFNQVLEQEGIAVTILPGQIVKLTESIIEEFNSGFLLKLHNTNYILLELSDEYVPPNLADLLYQLQLLGVVPILSRPERHQYFTEQPDVLYRLVKQGVLIQISSTSVTGKAGSYIRRITDQMIAGNLVHLISADMDKSRSDILTLQKAFYQIENKFGTETSDLLKENNRRILKNSIRPFDEPQKFKRKRYMGLF